MAMGSEQNSLRRALVQFVQLVAVFYNSTKDQEQFPLRHGLMEYRHMYRVSLEGDPDGSFGLSLGNAMNFRPRRCV